MASKRKNGLVGPIPGAGRKKEGNIPKTYRYTKEALEILNDQELPGQYASRAIVYYHQKVGSKQGKDEK